MAEKRVLIVSYSYSHQTRNLLKSLIKGLEDEEVLLTWERVSPLQDLRFPIGTIFSTVVMMLKTFFRKRYPIMPLNPSVFQQWDLIILAGPTWSYNPSGPILSLLDRDGKNLIAGQSVLPFISCRGYWRVHFWGLRSLLKKCGARIICAPIVFSHPTPEPWRTIGVFLKLAGKDPEVGASWFCKFYPKYGHSRKQMELAYDIGKKLGHDIMAGKKPSKLKFQTPISSQEDY
ncbi:MAG: hypothetical protein KKE53_01420 [Proteobacteria bacterium]|nr:hypothetical protein [Pseudomonadota bacterium]